MIMESMLTLAVGCASVHTASWHPYKNIFFLSFSKKGGRQKYTDAHIHMGPWNKNKAAEWIESFFTVTGHARCVYAH